MRFQSGIPPKQPRAGHQTLLHNVRGVVRGATIPQHYSTREGVVRKAHPGEGCEFHPIWLKRRTLIFLSALRTWCYLCVRMGDQWTRQEKIDSSALSAHVLLVVSVQPLLSIRGSLSTCVNSAQACLRCYTLPVSRSFLALCKWVITS
jgi:hypothetical protein